MLPQNRYFDKDFSSKCCQNKSISKKIFQGNFDKIEYFNKEMSRYFNQMLPHKKYLYKDISSKSCHNKSISIKIFQENFAIIKIFC